VTKRLWDPSRNRGRRRLPPPLASGEGLSDVSRQLDERAYYMSPMREESLDKHCDNTGWREEYVLKYTCFITTREESRP
jgi:hypothetical protein